MKKKLIIAISILFFGTLVYFGFSYKKNTQLPINYTHATYAYDLSTPEKAVGATDYVFIGKVNTVNRVEYRFPQEIETNADGTQTKIVSDPYTVYDVTVIKNIKGNLVENVELVQYGGISKDNDSYIYLDGTEPLLDDHYYVFLAFATTENGEMQISTPYSYLELDYTDGEDILEKPLAKKYINAYDNQIVPESKHNFFKSKYDSNN